MKRQILEALIQRAEEVAERYSQPRDRAGGVADQWRRKSVQPLSETIAVVVFEKESQQQVVGFFHYINGGQGPYWSYWIPTYDHLYGMQSPVVAQTMAEVERHNTELKLWQSEAKNEIAIFG